MRHVIHAPTGMADGVAKPQRLWREARREQRPGTAPEAFFETTMGPSLPPVVAVPLRWLRRLRHRHELAGLSEAQLRDVGLDLDLVRRESAKPFWRE